MRNEKIIHIVIMGAIVISFFSITSCGTQQSSMTEDEIEQDSEELTESNDLDEDATEMQIKEQTDLMQQEETEDAGTFDFTICFAGDINFDENWSTMQYYNTCENGIYDCISADLIEKMQSADLMCINNEFTYSTGGTALDGKAYTFRADPSRVSILNQLGVDVVNLANNHVYDYGEQALLDTFDTLDSAGIPYFGAGHDLEEAVTPVYLEAGGKTIAFVGASRAEKTKMTPQATDTSAGILRCYDTTLFDQEIALAKENADYVIVYVHWGTEYSDELQDVQLSTGKEYLDAGADAVIGAHSHCLQGMEYYDGKPIVYSLGNFWFNEKTLDTMLVTLHFKGDDSKQSLEVEVTPALQAEHTTTGMIEEAEKQELFDYLESISVNVSIDENGFVTEQTE